LLNSELFFADNFYDLFLFFAANIQPFMVNFQTDGFTSAAAAIIVAKGFNLIYWQTTTC
jgi:hypothetical protein